MKTDATGDASAGYEAHDKLEERLSSRFGVELDRAERDYPALRQKLVGAAAPGRGGRRLWPRIALPITTAAVLAVLALVGVGLAWRPATGPAAGSPSAPAPSGIVMGSDGIPSRIGGERVYRVTDKAEWQNIQGSFLLGSVPTFFVPSCIAVGSSLVPERDLIQSGCGTELVGVLLGGGTPLAPRTAVPVAAWVGHPVALRVHTNDPEAAQCQAAQRAACDAAVVVESVVWPFVPTEIAGEHVYRAADKGSFASLSAANPAGTFLLGGLVTEPDVIPACPAPQVSEAELQLVPYCSWVSVDGLQLSPKGLAIADMRNRVAVVRVHVNDPLAAQCPAESRSFCQAAVVVESVVWQGEPLAGPTQIAGPTPTPGVRGSPIPTPGVPSNPIPAPTDQVGPDGVPATLSGAPVYRAANLPATQAFLLGGKLTRDTSCAAPSAPLAKPPSCGYWMLDGVKVGTAVDMPASLLGQPVVATVQRGRTLAVCPDGSCTTDTIVVFEIVWPKLPPTPPTPLTP